MEDPLSLILKEMLPKPKLILLIIPTIIFLFSFIIPKSYLGLLSINIYSTMSTQDKWIADSIGIYYFFIVVFVLIKYFLINISIKAKSLIIKDYYRKLSNGDIDPIKSPKITAFFLLCFVLINLISIFYFTNPMLEKFAGLYSIIHSSVFVYFLFNLIVNNFMILFLIMSIYFMEIDI